MKKGQKVLSWLFVIILVYALGEQVFQAVTNPSKQTTLDYIALGFGAIGAACMLYLLLVVQKRG